MKQRRLSMKKMIRTLMVFVMVLVLAFTVIGCAKVTETKDEDVIVTVIDEYYRGRRVQPVRAGKVTTYVTHPAQYKIYVTYDGVEYCLDDAKIYNEYSNKIGTEATAILRTTYYDNGKVKKDIVDMKIN